MNTTPDNLGLFYDTETTGLPLWREPSGDPGQPHLVQLAAALTDIDTETVIQSIDLIIRPDGWTIPTEVTEIHGITTEMAMDLGVPEDFAVSVFMELWRDGRKRIAHNESFDARIMRIALKRYYGDEAADRWKAGDADCTCWMAKDAMGVGKKPKLEEAYEQLIGLPLENAHSALADMNACKDVYFSILRAA